MSKGMYLHCQYADDLRQEVGNKITIVGVYSNNLVVPGTFPATLPKLAAMCSLFLPHPVVAKRILVNASYDGLLLQELDLPTETMENLRHLSLTERTTDSQGMGITFGFVFQPLALEKEGKLRIVATVDGTEIKGNALAVTAMPPDTSQPNTPTS